MNPDMQIILDEISKRFVDHDAKWDRRAAEQDARWEAAFSTFTSGQEQRITAIERASRVFDDWRTSMEGVVDDLRLEVGKISKHWERALVDKPLPMLGVLAPTPMAVARPSTGHTANLPYGHRADLMNQEMGLGQ